MTVLENSELFCRPAEERALLSYAMKDINHYYSIFSKLSSSDFLYSQHQLILMLFTSLVTKGAEKLDANIVVAEAQAENMLDLIGGFKYIQTLENMKLADANFEVYLTAVSEASTKYKLHNALNENLGVLAENAKEGLDASELIGKVEGKLFDLSLGQANVDEPKNLADTAEDYIEERKDNKVEIMGLSTGYPILDKQIDGMVPTTLLVIAARKKMGKSALLTNIALHVATRLRKTVLYVDTELSYPEWLPRALAIMSGVPERDIKHGGYTDEQYAKLMKANEIIKRGGKMFHEYMPGYSVDKLVALYKKYKLKEDLGLIIFDYLKEPDSSSVERNRKEHQILGDVTTRIKDLAGELNIPALTAVQLNRKNDIADSDRIARYGDVICFWGNRTEEEVEEGGDTCGAYKLVIKDSRRGGSTSDTGIGFNFFKEQIQIKEVTPDKQYFTNFDKVVNVDSAGRSDEELF